MGQNIKQIYVTLEILDNEIKILVAEYYNTRFNILKLVRNKTNAIDKFNIVDKELLKNDITNTIDECANKLGTKIEKVILIIPAYNFKRFPVKKIIIPSKGILTKNDIAKALSESLNEEVDDDVIAVNAMASKYTINGISTRRLPEKEMCEEASVDIDLLCADKQLVIDYVTILEEIGVEVIDIVLNTYAISKEASLFEESLKQNVLLLDIQNNYSFLSLINKGKLISTEIINECISKIALYVRSTYEIPDEDINKLIKYDINYDASNLDDVIYAYNEANITKTITINDLNNVCKDAIDGIVDKICVLSKDIIEEGANIFVTGEGEKINALISEIENRTNCDINRYYPEIIGVRDPSLTSIYGALFAYHDKVMLYNLNVNCIDLLEYDALIDQKQLDSEGETLTTKIKNLFKQYIEKEK